MKIKTNVNEVIQWLVGQEDKLVHDVDEFVRRLAEEGSRAAQIAFGSAVSVYYTEIEGGYLIGAIGDDNHSAVGFLEFGAGDGTYVYHPFRNNVPFPVAPGSWSVQHSQQYYYYGEWHFAGQLYTKITAKHGMLDAWATMQLQFTTIAHEVFG